MATGASFDFHALTWNTRSASSQWRASMAIAVIFGLAFTTLLTLVVPPTLYLTLSRLAAWLGLAGPSTEEDESAVQAEPTGASSS